MLKFINLTSLTLYCSFIFWLSSQQALPTPMLFIHQDKIHHMGAYFIMAIFAWRFFSDYFDKSLVIIVASISFCSIYGLSDEWHQSYVPGRDADLLDWLADTIGASIAVLFIQLLKNKFKNKKTRPQADRV